MKKSTTAKKCSSRKKFFIIAICVIILIIIIVLSVVLSMKSNSNENTKNLQKLLEKENKIHLNSDTDPDAAAGLIGIYLNQQEKEGNKEIKLKKANEFSRKNGKMKSKGSTSKCTLTKDGFFYCNPDPGDEYKDFPPCDSSAESNPCDQLISTTISNVRQSVLPNECITGEQYWSNNNPRQGVGQMRFGNCAGSDKLGGSCDLKTYINSNLCPAGTKPWFFSPGMNKSTHENFCNAKDKGYFKQIQFLCCDPNKFNVPDPTSSTDKPDSNFCMNQVFQLQKKEDDYSGIYSVLVGRTGSGGGNKPESNHDGCDIDENKGENKLNTLLQDINKRNWVNPTHCD